MNSQIPIMITLIFMILPMDSPFHFKGFTQKYLKFSKAFDFPWRNITLVYMENSSTITIIYFLLPMLVVFISPIKSMWSNSRGLAFPFGKNNTHDQVEKKNTLKVFDSLEHQDFLQKIVIYMAQTLMPKIFYIQVIFVAKESRGRVNIVAIVTKYCSLNNNTSSVFIHNTLFTCKLNQTIMIIDFTYGDKFCFATIHKCIFKLRFKYP